MQRDFTTRRFALALVACLLLTAAGRSGDVNARQPATSEADTTKIEAESPEAVFEVFKQAAGKEDWPTFCECMTESGRKEFAADLVIFLSVSLARTRSNRSPFTKRIRERFRAVFKKHDLDSKELTELPLEDLQSDRNPSNPHEIEELRRVVLPMVEDVKRNCDLIGDGLDALYKTFAGFGAEHLQLIKSNAKLKDLKIDGDLATATFVQTNVNEETQALPITFRKTKGGWRISEPPLVLTHPSDGN